VDHDAPRRAERWTLASITTAAMAMLVLIGCGSSHRATVAAAGPDRAATVPIPRRHVVASRMPHRRVGSFQSIRPGTVIPAREVDARAFSDSRRGFGLATVVNGETFPATTTNGGATWRINGPVFHVPAADGTAGVSYTGVSSARAYFAYGSSVVDATPDAGRTWWQTFLGELVLAVVAQHGHLIAVVQQQASSTSESLKSVNWVYVSQDRGRHWRYTNQLGAR
jgi:hypothetical protein